MIKSRSMRWAGHVARMGKMWYSYKILISKLEGKRQLDRPNHKWEDNINMYLNPPGTFGDETRWLVEAQTWPLHCALILCSLGKKKTRRKYAISKVASASKFRIPCRNFVKWMCNGKIMPACESARFISTERILYIEFDFGSYRSNTTLIYVTLILNLGIPWKKIYRTNNWYVVKQTWFTAFVWNIFVMVNI
jgi:hypothetical protein